MKEQARNDSTCVGDLEQPHCQGHKVDGIIARAGGLEGGRVEGLWLNGFQLLFGERKTLWR